MPTTLEQSTGDIFVSGDFELDIAAGMTKGLGAATIAKMLNQKSKLKYDMELEAYLEHGFIWWYGVEARVCDEKWNTYSDSIQEQLGAERKREVRRQPVEQVSRLLGVHVAGASSGASSAAPAASSVTAAVARARTAAATARVAASTSIGAN